MQINRSPHSPPQSLQYSKYFIDCLKSGEIHHKTFIQHTELLYNTGKVLYLSLCNIFYKLENLIPQASNNMKIEK